MSMSYLEWDHKTNSDYLSQEVYDKLKCLATMRSSYTLEISIWEYPKKCMTNSNASPPWGVITR